MVRVLAFVALLCVLSGATRADEMVPPVRLRTAIERGLKRVESGGRNYMVHRACFSCHHQLSASVLVEAQDRGFPITADAIFLQVEFTRESFRTRVDQIVAGKSIGGANTTAAYALFVLESASHPADETTAALIQFLLARQAKDGSWPAVTNRPPSEGSAFTNAALALRALRTYGLQDDSFSGDLHRKIDAAWGRGRDWLLANEPQTMEDRVFHLQAMVECGVDSGVIRKFRDMLASMQRDDGGWAQLPERSSDAYATALALIALQRAGDAVTSKPWQRGAAFLLRTQQADGSWHVKTRSKPIQVFFDNGDPGGESQFISMTATNWALLALLKAAPKHSY